MKYIDLNADLGESQPTEAALMTEIASANIACGGHTGDEQTMRQAIEQCLINDVAIGAHPSYPDRKNFGRVSMDIPVAELTKSIAYQLEALMQIAEIMHVKPHGALYNDAAKNAAIAQAIAYATPKHLILYGLRGSVMLDVWKQAGYRTASEVFADRAYLSDGSLKPRSQPGALITEPVEASANALTLAEEGADTICVHSDTPNAIAIAQAVRRILIANGFTIRHI
jgi:UPF0271 protein